MFESEDFNRLLRLIVRGCTMVLRKVLGTLCAPLSISDYIYKHPDKVVGLKHFSSEKQLVTDRSTDKMDISLLCKLILGVFDYMLSGKLKSYITAIKELRDNFLHSDTLEIAAVEKQEFEKQWNAVSGLLIDTIKEGDIDSESEVNNMIDAAKEDSSDLNEISELL